jgi:nucleoside-diphosphate-sugar epimerase
LIYCTGLSGTIGTHLQGHVENLDIDLTASQKDFEKINLHPNSTIIHLAAMVGEKAVLKDESYARAVNVQGTERIAKLALDQKSNLVFISTGHVYKPSAADLNEQADLEPNSLYAQQKLEAEKAVVEVLNGTRSTGMILRVFSLLDFGMPEFTLGGAAERLGSKADLEPLKSSDDIRDFLTPKQVAAAILSIVTTGSSAGIYNLASGTGIKVKSAVVALLDSKGIKVDDRHFENGNSKIPRLVADVQKIKDKYKDLDLYWPYSNTVTA